MHFRVTMAFAVIKTGGKQYVVEPGDVLEVEKLEAEPGAKIDCEVLLVSDGKDVQIGTPLVSEKVEVEVVEQGRAPRILVRTYKAKKREKKAYGHRQPFTRIRIVKIGTATASAETGDNLPPKMVSKKKAASKNA